MLTDGSLEAISAVLRGQRVRSARSEIDRILKSCGVDGAFRDEGHRRNPAPDGRQGGMVSGFAS